MRDLKRYRTNLELALARFVSGSTLLFSLQEAKSGSGTPEVGTTEYQMYKLITGPCSTCPKSRMLKLLEMVWNAQNLT